MDGIWRGRGLLFTINVPLTGTTPFQSLVPNFVFVTPSNCISFRPHRVGPTPVFIPAQPEGRAHRSLGTVAVSAIPPPRAATTLPWLAWHLGQTDLETGFLHPPAPPAWPALLCGPRRTHLKQNQTSSPIPTPASGGLLGTLWVLSLQTPSSQT